MTRVIKKFWATRATQFTDPVLRPARAHQFTQPVLRHSSAWTSPLLVVPRRSAGGGPLTRHREHRPPLLRHSRDSCPGPGPARSFLLLGYHLYYRLAAILTLQLVPELLEFLPPE